jgi:hypothetical protein
MSGRGYIEIHHQYLTYVGYILLEPRNPTGTKNKPEFKRSEPSAKAKMPVAIINNSA